MANVVNNGGVLSGENGKSGVITWKMASPYVYIGGHIEGEGRLPDPAWSGYGEQTLLGQPLRKVVDYIGASHRPRQTVRQVVRAFGRRGCRR